MKAHQRMALIALAGALGSSAFAKESVSKDVPLNPKAPVQLVKAGQAVPLAKGLAIAKQRAELQRKQEAQQRGVNKTEAVKAKEIPNTLVPDAIRFKTMNNDSDAIAAKKKKQARNAKTAATILAPSPAAGISFNGYSQSDNTAVGAPNVAPPDVNGDVGVDYYVQYVNLGWVVYNKSDGSVAAGPFIGNSFWQGFGGVCETTNAGDPIVLYDHLADRWVFSQFTPQQADGGHQCFAVSQGPDLVDDINNGNFSLYDFNVSAGFNDYEKISVWPDGYYMSHNEFNPSFVGVGITWFDRTAMLAGNPASIQTQFLPDPGAGERGRFNLEPAHLEGGSSAPPAGTCGMFVMANDWEVWNNGGPEEDDAYLFYEYCVDANNPANTTFNQVAAVSAPEFNSSCLSSGFGSTCAPQPGTSQQLDTLPQMTMYRFSTRMINGELKGSIAHNVNDGNNVMTVRWATFDLDSSGAGNHTLTDSGNLDTSDGLFRFMGSSSIDQDGNLGLVYTRSGSGAGQFPSVYFAGRLASDPAGETRTESVCVDGSGFQQGTSRWGDYASVSVDPVDQCTFWITEEYVETTGSFNWATRVCSFKFDECGEPGFFITASDTNQKVCTTNDNNLAPINLTIGQVQGFSNDVTLSYSGLPAGVNGNFSVNPVSLPGASVASVSTPAGLASGQYQFTIEGAASGADDRQVNVSFTAFDSAPGALTLQAPADNSSGIGLSPTFSWDAANAGESYTIEIATDAGFANIVETATVNGTSYTSTGLTGNTRYYWRVKAANICGDGAYSQTFSFITSELFCEAPALSIPDGDGNGATFSLMINEPGQLNDLNALINLNHTWVGDLIVTLEHVDTGTTVTLLDRPGRTTSGFGCSGNDINNIFDDDGTLSAENDCTSPNAYPADAVLIPNDALAAFNGEDLAGEWRVFVSDNAFADTGTFNEFCLIPDAQVPGDFNDDGCIDIDDMRILLDAIRAGSNDSKFDLNGDGTVNSRDRRTLIGLYTNPRGARCN
ncbi:fibronectin type III domain-containing protein [Pleionea sp. CnH1-48]|uniref:fibronectin type III domain-containing protein n=1 Tax=Pleionea sp. CnH1-48 TaxID=2954494 RepID=UPI0020982346|nr:proprotein convertase P-domain-containing protein [Pleionea sp. CnH1-48]MCO7227278.1 proprotein convertase P-domain-containing protein [Pleionea sp. CnH1-48]